MTEDVSPKPPVEPTYLGDGVYGRSDGYQLWIWVSNGIENGPQIALEPGVINNILGYAKRCGIIG